MGDQKKWRFCVSGNIVKTHPDEEGIIRYGTKAFSGGTKVYLGGKAWEKTRDNIGVIGKNRFGRYAVEFIPVMYIENIRFQRVHKPSIIEIMDYEECIEGWPWWGRTAADRKDAEAFVKIFQDLTKPDRERVKP